MIPEFNKEGNLPFGLIECTEDEFLGRFAITPRRRELASRLTELLSLARESGLIERAIVWGSYVTSKPDPGDMDLLLVARERTEPDQVSARFRVLFDYSLARQRFGMDVFWVQANARALLQEFLEMARTGRQREPRGVVEIRLS